MSSKFAPNWQPNICVRLIYIQYTEHYANIPNKEIYAIVKKPTITETKRLHSLCCFGQNYYSIIYEFGNNEAERQTKK